MCDELNPCLTKKCKARLPQLVEDEGMFCYWCPNCKEQGGWAKTPKRAAYQWNAPRSGGLESFMEMKRENEASEMVASEEERVRQSTIMQFQSFLASTYDEEAEDEEDYFQQVMERD